MTRASETQPTRRVVTSRGGDDYVVEVYRGVLVMRPKGSRSPRVRVGLGWGQLYIQLLTAQLEAEHRAKRKGPKRVRR